jgi:hypothetical protein
MGRTKFSSPKIDIEITPDQYDRAVRSASGGCLIADAIREKYPQFTRVTVDMATIRVSDRKAGVRYTYLTPAPAKHVLLAFDQGWSQRIRDLVIKRAVQITPITRHKTGPNSPGAVDARRHERVSRLATKAAGGKKLTKGEKISLAKSRNPKRAPERPSTPGPVQVHVDSRGAVVHGGNGPLQGPAHPNLLRGQDRHFGAKLADPGIAFREAVDAAVEEKLAELRSEA